MGGGRGHDALTVGSFDRIARHRRVGQAKEVDDLQVRKIVGADSDRTASHQRVIGNHSVLHALVGLPCPHSHVGELAVFRERRGDELPGSLAAQVVRDGDEHRHRRRGEQPRGVGAV